MGIRNGSFVCTACAVVAFLGLASADCLYVSPDGTTAAAGTESEPLSLPAAIVALQPGDTAWVRGGTYTLGSQVTIERTNSGASGALKHLIAYANERPVLDFSSQPYGTGTNPRGLQIDGSFWHVKGLEVKGSADNGVYISGSSNIIESCVVHKNRDSGLQLGRWSSSAPSSEWPAGNLILNCESYDNYDAPPGAGENADGFACKLTTGPGNVFSGCYSHHNIDDGWDLYTKTETGAIGPVTIDRCIAADNGTLTDGTVSAAGDRNGFKLGGESIAVAHIVTRCVAFGNGKNGFTWNSNPGAIKLVNCLAYDNTQGNYTFGSSTVTTAAEFYNNVSFWTSGRPSQSEKHVGLDVDSSNCWWDASKARPSINARGLVVTGADFAGSLAGAMVGRDADGSLDYTPFQLAAGSDLIDAGATPAFPGLPFVAADCYRGKPDLGAVEYQGTRLVRDMPARSRSQVAGRRIPVGAFDVAGRTGRTACAATLPSCFLTPANHPSRVLLEASR